MHHQRLLSPSELIAAEEDRASEYALEPGYDGCSEASLLRQARADLRQEQSDLRQRLDYAASPEAVRARQERQERARELEETERQERAAAEAAERAFRATPAGRRLSRIEEDEREMEELCGSWRRGGRWPGWLADLCDHPPAAGSGVHYWLFRMALALHPRYDNKAELRRVMLDKAQRAGRTVPDRELDAAIADAGQRLNEPGGGRRFRWPEPDLAEINRVVYSGAGMDGLRRRSPVDCGTPEPQTRVLLPLLFPGDPLLCLATQPNRAHTQRLSAWLERDVEAYSFIVPNPMRSASGLTREGRESCRCLDNVAERRYLVIECDFSTRARDALAPLVEKWGKSGITVPDACASILLRLSQYLDLALAVSSAGKSVHGWFPAASETEDDLWHFLRLAVALGADRATEKACQLVRNPDGSRHETGQRQQVWYFNPATLPTERC